MMNKVQKGTPTAQAILKKHGLSATAEFFISWDEKEHDTITLTVKDKGGNIIYQNFLLADLGNNDLEHLYEDLSFPIADCLYQAENNSALKKQRAAFNRAAAEYADPKNMLSFSKKTALKKRMVETAEFSDLTTYRQTEGVQMNIPLFEQNRINIEAASRELLSPAKKQRKTTKAADDAAFQRQ